MALYKRLGILKFTIMKRVQSLKNLGTQNFNQVIGDAFRNNSLSLFWYLVSSPVWYEGQKFNFSFIVQAQGDYGLRETHRVDLNSITGEWIGRIGHAASNKLSTVQINNHKIQFLPAKIETVSSLLHVLQWMDGLKVCHGVVTTYDDCPTLTLWSQYIKETKALKTEAIVISSRLHHLTCVGYILSEPCKRRGRPKVMCSGCSNLARKLSLFHKNMLSGHKVTLKQKLSRSRVSRDIYRHGFNYMKSRIDALFQQDIKLPSGLAEQLDQVLKHYKKITEKGDVDVDNLIFDAKRFGIWDMAMEMMSINLNDMTGKRRRYTSGYLRYCMLARQSIGRGHYEKFRDLNFIPMASNQYLDSYFHCDTLQVGITDRVIEKFVEAANVYINKNNLPPEAKRTIFHVHMSFDECTLNQAILWDRGQEAIIGPICDLPTININSIENSVASHATIVALRSSMHSDFRFPLCIIGECIIILIQLKVC